MDIREQRFGIEIELTGITRSSAARAVAGKFGTRSDHVGGGDDGYHVVDGEGRTWKVMSDSSLRTEKREDGHKRAASNHYKVEVVSPILRYGDIETLQEIVRALRRKGAFANDSCGIHVHVDAAAHTPKTLRTLSNIVASKEDLLYRARGGGRSRVEPQVHNPHAVEALPAERGDLGVQALAQARDLGLRHGRHAEGPRHLLDLARGDAEHVHLGYRGDERAVHPAVAL